MLNVTIASYYILINRLMSQKSCYKYIRYVLPPPLPGPLLLGKRNLFYPAPHFPLRFRRFFLGFVFIAYTTTIISLDIFRYLFHISTSRSPFHSSSSSLAWSCDYVMSSCHVNVSYIYYILNTITLRYYIRNQINNN